MRFELPKCGVVASGIWFSGCVKSEIQIDAFKRYFDRHQRESDAKLSRFVERLRPSESKEESA